MGENKQQTTQLLQSLIDRVNAGDDAACRSLVDRSYERLRKLLQTMLYRNHNPARGQKQTDDVLQNAALKIWQKLEDRLVGVTSVREYFGFSALEMRRELINLVRRDRNRIVAAGSPADPTHPTVTSSDTTHDPAYLARWTEFHETVDRLPGDLRDVVDLVFYQGLSTSEAAELLDVSHRTVQLRWAKSRLRLQQETDRLPGV